MPAGYAIQDLGFPRRPSKILPTLSGYILMQLEHIKTGLETAGVSFAPGLTSSEIRAAEARFGFIFPPDLRNFLMFAMPIGDRIPNWRDLDDPYLLDAFGWPLEGLLFDVGNSIWLPSWGPRPANDGAAVARVTALVQAAPALIPIKGHRYMPALPCEAGNPVLSVYQSDIICYGLNLEDFFHNEYSHYFGRQGYQMTQDPKHIEFWSSFLDSARTGPI